MCERCEQLGARVKELEAEAEHWRHEARRAENRADDFQGNCINLDELLLASQLEVTRLREALENAQGWRESCGLDVTQDYEDARDLLSTPSPTTALDALIEQARREATKEPWTLVEDALPTVRAPFQVARPWPGGGWIVETAWYEPEIHAFAGLRAVAWRPALLDRAAILAERSGEEGL